MPVKNTRMQHPNTREQTMPYAKTNIWQSAGLSTVRTVYPFYLSQSSCAQPHPCSALCEQCTLLTWVSLLVHNHTLAQHCANSVPFLPESVFLCTTTPLLSTVRTVYPSYLSQSSCAQPHPCSALCEQCTLFTWVSLLVHNHTLAQHCANSVPFLPESVFLCTTTPLLSTVRTVYPSYLSQSSCAQPHPCSALCEQCTLLTWVSLLVHNHTLAQHCANSVPFLPESVFLCTTTPLLSTVRTVYPSYLSQSSCAQPHPCSASFSDSTRQPPQWRLWSPE